jgi:hypothetical protein
VTETIRLHRSQDTLEPPSNPGQFSHVLTSAISYSAGENLVPLGANKCRLLANRLVVFWWYELTPHLS